MAKIVLGIGTSHSPQLSVRASEWQVLREKDENDPRLDYQKLVQRAKANLESELTSEKFRQRDEACQRAIKTLGDTLQEVNPDVVVVFGDDQHEQFQDENMPTFAVYHGQSLPVVTHTGRNPAAWKTAEERGWAETAPEYEARPALADHLIRSLVDAEFDIARCSKLRPEIGVGHGIHRTSISLPRRKRVIRTLGLSASSRRGEAVFPRKPNSSFALGLGRDYDPSRSCHAVKRSVS